MSKFLKALAKVGLVELDESERSRLRTESAPEEDLSQEEISRILADAKKVGGDASAESTEPGLPPAAPAPAYDSGVSEGRDFDAIYGEMSVPPSPFPAEKLLKLLDGLRAMDPHTRKAAVLAMDSADETWTIEDAILDARRKIDALQQAKQRVRATVQTTEESARRELEETAKYQDEVTSTIRKQMADLEAMLQRELESVATQKAEIHARVEAERSAAAREEKRFDHEIVRLTEIPKTFHVQEAVKHG
jgi:hypothetical protein